MSFFFFEKIIAKIDTKTYPPMFRRASKASTYSKSDIWVVSRDAAFVQSPLLVRSVFHGPARSGMLQVAKLDGNLRALASKASGESNTGRNATVPDKHLYAMPLLNASSELQMYDNLGAMQADDIPGLSFAVRLGAKTIM